MMRSISQSVVASFVLSTALCARAAITTLELNIPDTPVRDEFYYLTANFTGQPLPLMLDTGSADILVASNQCDNTNSSSGCYKSKLFHVPKNLDIIKGEVFSTTVGSGPVSGNQSFMSVGFGQVTVNNLAVPLIYEAAKEEFQNGSFSGILGAGMLSVSREEHYFKQLPPINKMIADKLLSKPVFSISVPRYGDPASPKHGKLTLGGIETITRYVNITYSDIVKAPTYNNQGPKFSYSTWTQELQGYRVNGHDIPIPKTGFGMGNKFIATMDTGGENMALGQLFDLGVKYFKGTKQVIPGVWVWFDCAQPQLIEFKFNGQWIPIDPLDMIAPGQVRVMDGTTMCLATAQNGNSAYANILLGPQFFRNALTVFDYVSDKPFSVPPRMGLAPLTDADAAVKRYASLYMNRLH